MAINKNFTVSAGIDVAAGANVGTALNVGTTANVAGTLGVVGVANFSNNVVIAGNLTVSGTTTYVNTATMNIADNIMTLNADISGAPSENAGLEVNRGTSANVQLIWNETTDKWQISNGSSFADIHSKLADIVLGTDTSGNYVSGVTSGTTAITIGGTAGEGWAPTVSIRSANTSVDGIVRLTDEVSNTSVSVAASATAVKTAYDTAVTANNTAATAYSNAIAFAANATNLTNGTLDVARLPATVNVTAAFNVGSNVNLTTAALNIGNSTVNTTITSTNIGGNSNAQHNIVNAVTYNTTTAVNVGANVVINTSSVSVGNTTVNASINSTMFSGVANNSNNLGGQAPAFYTNASNITNGTLPYAQVPANVTNTTANFTITGAWTYNANVTVGVGKNLVLSSTSGISANNTYGSVGQALYSNGTAVYWATPFSGVTSVGSGNGLTGGAITSTGTLSVVAANGISVTAAGVNVLAGTNSGLVSNSTGVYIGAGTGLTASGGTLAVNPTYITGLVNTNTANNSTYFNGQAASFYTDIPSRLGFTPVQQGGGTGQGSNKLYVGWLGSQLGLQVDSSNYGGTWPININGTAGGVAWGNVSGRPTAVSSFTNDSGYITSGGRAYPRRSDGGDINFFWSGQAGQPTWLWGGSDGTNMYVYNPSNFSVNYATSAGNADTVDGWHRDDIRNWNNFINVPSLVYMSQFTQSIGLPGWCKLPNGLMIQWGYINGIGQDSYGSVATPTTWPTTGLVVVGSRYSGAKNNGEGTDVVEFPYDPPTKYSSGGTNYNAIRVYNGNDITSNFYYIAIGY